MHLYRLPLLAALLFAPLEAIAQTDRTESVRVYLDCNARGCDQDYFIEQIGFVNWVRDRANADVHLLVSTLSTGSGGEEYSIAFLGANRFAGVRDSLKFNSTPNASQDATRSGLMKVVRLGLVRFAAGTAAGRDIQISYDAPKNQAKAAIRDPWNFWTFDLSANGFGDGEKSYSSLFLFGGLEANRITERWKVELEIENRYNQTRFELTSGTFYNYRRSSNATALMGRSIGPRWTVGGFTGVGRSDFENLALQALAAPAIEYDVYPYKEATRRQLTVLYVLGPRYFRFQDTTLYDKLRQTELYQQMIIALRTKQEWGSTDVSVTGSSYLTEPDFYRLEANGHIELQIVKGLSLRLGGYAARVNDQLSLQKEGLTDEERLVRQQALATNYQYWFSAGFSYTFGSIYNTIVNPRFNNLGDF